MNIGRNDLCPCGSGKKYKRCCLNLPPSGFTREERFSALDRLDDFVAKQLGAEDDDAYEVFYEEWHDLMEELDSERTALSEAVYDMWFYLDHRLPGGELAVDRFLDHNPDLSPGERRYLRLLRETAMRLYEIEDLSPGESVTLRDVLDDTKVTVHERQGSRSLWRHALVAARIISRGPSGRPEIETGLLQIPDLVREQVVSQLLRHRENYRREHPGTGETEFYKAAAPLFHDAWISCILRPPVPHMTNTDGDELLATTVRFDVADPHALEAALAETGELEREDDGKAVWIWSGSNQKGDSVILGRLVLEGQSLKLECNSSQRAERGRALIEGLAANLVRHRSTAHESTERAVRERIRSGGSGEEPRASAPDDLPREVKEALTLDAYARHYQKWIDEPIPALDGRTPRHAALDSALRPKLVDLIHGLEIMYQQALRKGDPAYDPSWMWGELGMGEPSNPAHPPPLAHERMAALSPGFGEVCRTAAEHLRRQPGFDDASTVATGEEIRKNLELQRYLREFRRLADRTTPQSAERATRDLTSHVEYTTNFELHRRKTFWVDEALAYMLGKTDLDAPGRDVRVPFPCFALVFTDRHVLSLAERLLSTDEQCPLAGHYLRIATVYIAEERRGSGRGLRLWLACDALGADPPHVIEHEIPLADELRVSEHLREVAPPVLSEPAVPDAHPLRGLLHIILNAVLYATSAGIEPELRLGAGVKVGKSDTYVFSSEDVFFLPGAIEISKVRKLQELERVSGGRTILHRFMVRGHWRHAAAGWTDQRMRWIQPYWKGPDIAAVIERTYKLKP